MAPSFKKNTNYMQQKTSISVSGRQRHVRPNKICHISPTSFFSKISQNMSDELWWIHAMFQNIALLIAVTYFFALLSVDRAKYRCIWYWLIELPCSQCTNPPITNTHTVWRVAGLRSQLTTYHTTQPKCPIVSQSIW